MSSNVIVFFLIDGWTSGGCNIVNGSKFYPTSQNVTAQTRKGYYQQCQILKREQKLKLYQNQGIESFQGK